MADEEKVPMLAIGIGKPKGEGGDDEDADEEQLKEASGELIKAVKSGDAEAVAMAFKAMHAICAEGY